VILGCVKIGPAKAILYLRAQMNLYPHFLLSLHDFVEMQRKKSAHNVVELLRVL
jgi:hypothetical protein